MIKTAFPAVAAMVLCCSAAAATGPETRSSIRLDRPWSPATPNGAPTAAAYMSIEKITGATTTVFSAVRHPLRGKVEVHEMSMAGGIMSMRALSGGLAIPAGQTVILEPQANYHLMLSGLKSPPKNGTQLPLTLNFAKAGMVLNAMIP